MVAKKVKAKKPRKRRVHFSKPQKVQALLKLRECANNFGYVSELIGVEESTLRKWDATLGATVYSDYGLIRKPVVVDESISKSNSINLAKIDPDTEILPVSRKDKQERDAEFFEDAYDLKEVALTKLKSMVRVENKMSTMIDLLKTLHAMTPPGSVPGMDEPTAAIEQVYLAIKREYKNK